MSLNALTIQNLRNIIDMNLEPHSRFNVIYGENGSGKTSILEAIYILGRGRTFRSAYNKKIIRSGEELLFIFSQSKEADTSNHLRIQIQNSQFQAKLNGQFLKKSSDLALYVPLLLITPDGDKLIKGSPRQRRRFLDWGLFHVEHCFFEIWQRYNRVLIQRNIALRQSTRQLSTWNKQLIDVGNELNRQRQQYANQLAEMAQLCFKELTNIESVTFNYLPGWNKGQTFAESLDLHIETDIKAGFTQRGPHRADLTMQINGHSANEYLSGGQIKLAACALYLAQARLYSRKLNKFCTLLVDDLPAELDEKHRKALLDMMYSTNGQVFITTTDLSLLNLLDYDDIKVFHVKHGAII